MVATVLLGIWGFLGGISIFIFIGILCWLLIALVSKLMGFRVVSRTGDTIADPNTLDNLTKLTKLGVSSLLDKVKGVNLPAFRVLTDNTSSKIEKLQQLQLLKESGTITSIEFDKLKNELLGSSTN